jgi:hypothetical protein
MDGLLDAPAFLDAFWVTVERVASVEIGEQLQHPMKPMRKSLHALPLGADRQFQQPEDFVDVRPDPFRRRVRLALRPQVVAVLDQGRAQPKAHALGIGPGRQSRCQRHHRARR